MTRNSITATALPPASMSPVGKALEEVSASFDRFCKAAEFHQRHAKRVPAVKKTRSDLDTAPVLLHRTFEITHREVAARVIKDLINRLHVKHQIGTSKLQITSNQQSSKCKLPLRLSIEVFRFVGCWRLEFGI